MNWSLELAGSQSETGPFPITDQGRAGCVSGEEPRDGKRRRHARGTVGGPRRVGGNGRPVGHGGRGVLGGTVTGRDVHDDEHPRLSRGLHRAGGVDCSGPRGAPRGGGGGPVLGGGGGGGPGGTPGPPPPWGGRGGGR